ncbi:PIR Superfamily Protein [Plasmodium ovale curtisi]|uniref:PIR Superfamily Protein n=1 Tax=Plasmodium ovale curtisi TaxID=864141 RepID=A0A1A8XA59_PLAOA|nr:PIR Superfamily Protein [Plasmodium ovale curtisi]
MRGGSSQEELGKLSGMNFSYLPSEKFYNDIKKEYEDLINYSELRDTNSVHNFKNEAKQICKKILRYLDKYPVYNDEKYGFDSYPNDKLQKTKYYKKCEPNFDIFKHVDWKKIRELYEYYVDYTTLFGLAQSFDDKCEYYKKIETKKTLYKHFDYACLSNESNCPEIYEKCRYYNPEKVLSGLSCHTKMEEKKFALKASSSHNTPGKEQETGDHGPRPGFPVVGTGSDKEMTQENSEIGTKIGHSVLGVAPVLLTATALYRYTPVGSWIRKLGGYNQSGISDMNGFTSYTQESGNMFSDSIENYISYQPI